jgi:hypothetical protein
VTGLKFVLVLGFIRSDKQESCKQWLSIHFKLRHGIVVPRRDEPCCSGQRGSQHALRAPIRHSRGERRRAGSCHRRSGSRDEGRWPKSHQAGEVHQRPCKPLGAQRPRHRPGCAEEVQVDREAARLTARESHLVREATPQGHELSLLHSALPASAPHLQGSSIITSQPTLLPA